MKTEKILGLTFIVGLVLRYYNLPYGFMTLTLSLFSLGTLYFPGALYFFSDKEFSRQNIGFSAISGLFLSLIAIAILFKTSYWMNGIDEIYFPIGLISIFILFFVAIFLRSKSKLELKNYYNISLIRFAIVFTIGLGFYMIPKKTLILHQYRNDPVHAQLIINVLEHPENEKFNWDLRNYLMKNPSVNGIK
jgi:hypothetical protein